MPRMRLHGKMVGFQYGENSLYELARKIERLYDVKINFENKELKTYRYTGRLRQLSLEQVLKSTGIDITSRVYD